MVNFISATADSIFVTSPATDPLPPDHRTVIERALCLSSLVVRGTLESAAFLANGPADAATSHALAQRLSHWLNDQEFTAQFTIDELDALSAVPGTWTAAQHETQRDLVEALGVLLWALSLHEKIPASDEAFPFPDLQPLLGWPANGAISLDDDRLVSFPYNGADLLLGITQLRSMPDFVAQRGVADCWQWRANIAANQRANPTLPPGHDYALLIGIAAEEAHAAGAITPPVQNDFPLRGRPFAKLPEGVQQQCARLAATRHLALDWLCGYATPWDALPVAAATELQAC